MKAPEGEGPQIKGAALLEALNWLEREHGRARVEAALARLSSASRARIDATRRSFGILASDWYPAENTHIVLGFLTEGLSSAEREQTARRLAKAIMEGTLHGVYGMLFNLMATPERYARHVSRLWSKFYDCGRVVAVLPTPSSMVATVSEWTSHDPFLCLTVQFARVAALEAMGCRNVRSELRCKDDVGGDACTTRITWEK